MRCSSMVHKGRQTERQRAAEVANEFVEEGLLPDDIEDDVISRLNREEPIRALETIIQHRKGRV
ncbi:hypothetical protein KM295_00180 [Natronomonas sp. F2-12]|uniref:Uncharacterized protein n=1 Tax=Natronomonas aquatica TaxID=2841590 RepID=A0A9R1CQE5_9EURY|nr:hypothetical protein [Natronomonas aquatica]MCQ4331923.1 hypothetical protein [Natronomonas aquatica]